MARSTFEPIRTMDADLVRVQQAIGKALDELAATVPRAPQLVSFVVAGNNGAGTVVISPVKDAAGNILRRARVGAKLVAVVNLTDDTDVQGSFEQEISVPDQIQQTTTNNLSAKKLLVVVAS
jgi:hypothetical protein